MVCFLAEGQRVLQSFLEKVCIDGSWGDFYVLKLSSANYVDDSEELSLLKKGLPFVGEGTRTGEGRREERVKEWTMPLP